MEVFADVVEKDVMVGSDGVVIVLKEDLVNVVVEEVSGRLE